MLVFRPVTPDDLQQLNDLANLAGFGLTTLPKDPDLLRNRIMESARSFERLTLSARALAAQSLTAAQPAHSSQSAHTSQSERPGGEIYLFVLEDLHTGRI